MDKNNVSTGFERLRDARQDWTRKRRDFTKGYDLVLRRLLHEGARAFMSPDEMARLLGVSVRSVRKSMREVGLDPKSGQRRLNEAASKALIGNAELLGVKPEEFDLTSPLAYLPMGEQMRKEILAVSKVTELDDEPVIHALDFIVHAVACGAAFYSQPIQVIADLELVTCSLCRDRMTR